MSIRILERGNRRGYAIWVIPPQEIYKEINNLMGELKQEGLTTYEIPHILLLDYVGDFGGEVVLLANAFYKYFEPLEIEMNRVGCEKGELYVSISSNTQIKRCYVYASYFFNHYCVNSYDKEKLPRIPLAYNISNTPYNNSEILEIEKYIHKKINNIKHFIAEDIAVACACGKPDEWYVVEYLSTKV